MATYAIGDLQGCYRSLNQLLDKLALHQQDQLWFCGDLINRGEDNVATLKLLRDLGSQVQVVLGNHDLHALAIYYGLRPLHRSDTIQDLLRSPLADSLFEWLRQQPLLIVDDDLKFCMVHAGIAPHWQITDAKIAASDLCQALQANDPRPLLTTIYGNEPHHWQDINSPAAAQRYAFNTLTRMRYVDQDGGLDFAHKSDQAPAELMPWFAYPRQQALSHRVVFGHWSAIGGKIMGPQFFAVDTGCVWGGPLTALNLQTLTLTQVQSHPV